MLILADEVALMRALALPIDPNLKALLSLRRDQLQADTSEQYDLSDLVNWIIVQPGDTFTAIEAAANYPLLPDPPWEWVLDHGGILEAPIIFSDDGFGVVLIVPDEEGVDPVLLDLLRRDAVSANGEGATA